MTMHKMVNLMAVASAMGFGDCWQRASDAVFGGPQCGITPNTHLDRMRRKERARELTRKRENEIKAMKERGK